MCFVWTTASVAVLWNAPKGSSDFEGGLAALRWPGAVLVFSDREGGSAYAVVNRLVETAPLAICFFHGFGMTAMTGKGGLTPFSFPT